ncbi:MAG: hypothetical protein WD013_02400 [Gemmatimonadota bacterium]
MTSSDRGRSCGGALVEMVVALTLGLVVLGCVGSAAIATLRSGRDLVRRVDSLELVRTVWVVLDEELASGRHGRDWRLDESGFLKLRAFRGIARVCGFASADSGFDVVYRGRRSPVPGRDSVLVLGTDARWRAFALDGSSSAGGCEGGETREVSRWDWEQPSSAPPPVLARLFERGSYHLVDGALRYRRGDGGRQPLTQERLLPESGFVGADEGVLVRLHLRGGRDSGHPFPFVWMVRGQDAW